MHTQQSNTINTADKTLGCVLVAYISIYCEYFSVRTLHVTKKSMLTSRRDTSLQLGIQYLLLYCCTAVFSTCTKCVNVVSPYRRAQWDAHVEVTRERQIDIVVDTIHTCTQHRRPAATGPQDANDGLEATSNCSSMHTANEINRL